MKPIANHEDWRRIRSQRHWSGGYTTFRHGTIAIRETHGSVDARSRITLAGQKKQPPIFNKDKRRHVIDTLFKAMSDWRFSPFQYEGVTRAHIRSFLCLKGYGWERADAEAACLVAQVLQGYQRPSYNEGQRNFTASIVTCKGCGGPLDDYEISNWIRFCCDECRRMAERRETGLSAGFIEQGPTKCQNPKCSNIFYPRDAFQEFCCRRCSVEGRGLLLPIKDCAYCDAPFQPANESALYCSARCNNRAKTQRKGERRKEKRQDQSCLHCGSIYTPKKAGGKFCSESCMKKAAYYRHKASKAAANPESPIQKIFDAA